MKTAVVPDLVLRQLHLLITKELLTLYELELAPNAKRMAEYGSADGRE